MKIIYTVACSTSAFGAIRQNAVSMPVFPGGGCNDGDDHGDKQTWKNVTTTAAAGTMLNGMNNLHLGCFQPDAVGTVSLLAASLLARRAGALMLAPQQHQQQCFISSHHVFQGHSHCHNCVARNEAASNSSDTPGCSKQAGVLISSSAAGFASTSVEKLQ